MQFLKNMLLIFMVMVMAACMATSAFADDYMDAVDQYKGRVDKYFESVKVYERSVDNKNRVADERINDLEAREQQQSVATPSASQFWSEPAQPTVAIVPVPVPTGGWRYYRYWNGDLNDWVFAPVWCPIDWAAPYGWYPVTFEDRYHFRHFSHGRVDGRSVSFSRPVDLQLQGQGGHGFQRSQGSGSQQQMMQPRGSQQQMRQQPQSQQFGRDPQPQGPGGGFQRSQGSGSQQQMGQQQQMQQARPPENFQRPQGQLQPRGNNAPVMRQPQIQASPQQQQFHQAPPQNLGGGQRQPQMQQTRPQPQARPAPPPQRPPQSR